MGCCSHWGFDSPASSGTISPSGLTAKTPLAPQGKIVEWWSSFQMMGRDSELSRGQQSRGWGHQHKLDSLGEGPGGRAVSRGHREVAPG